MSKFSFEPFPGGESITEYVTRYRRPDVPPFETAPPLDLFPSQPGPVGFAPKLTWKDPWPLHDRAGVYLVYSASFKLLYVGTSQYLASRLSAHFPGTADKECVIWEKWTEPPRYVINVAVPREMPFEAPALEAFLIRALRPPDNVMGKMM